MAEMVMGRNGSGPKMSSHRQMFSYTFILKFASVSEFQGHNTDDRKLRTPFFVCLNSMQQYHAVRRSPKAAPRNALECYRAIYSGPSSFL